MRTELSLPPSPKSRLNCWPSLAADAQTAKGPDAKPEPVLLTSDEAAAAAAAAVLASGEFKARSQRDPAAARTRRAESQTSAPGRAGQAGESHSTWRPHGAGTAVRFAKPRGIRELVFALPEVRSTARRTRCTRSRRRRLRWRLRPRHLSQRPQGPERPVLHRGRACRRRPGQRSRPPLPKASSSAKARTLPAPWSTSLATC